MKFKLHDDQRKKSLCCNFNLYKGCKGCNATFAAFVASAASAASEALQNKNHQRQTLSMYETNFGKIFKFFLSFFQ